jgi:NAD dependent epimerase/dehydratase family enzyme
MSDKWLVIGGIGLIGSELCIELRSRGSVVHSVSRKSSFHTDHIMVDVTETEWPKLMACNSTLDSRKIYEMTGWVPKKKFKLEMRPEK